MLSQCYLIYKDKLSLTKEMVTRLNKGNLICDELEIGKTYDTDKLLFSGYFISKYIDIYFVEVY